MNRTIFHVYTPGDQELTVVAGSYEEATRLAMEFCDDLDGDPGAYPPDKSMEPPTFWRWVGFSSYDDADDQAYTLESCGAKLGSVLLRETTRHGSEGPHLWEIGATDADWCRLPSGVLCGGDE